MPSGASSSPSTRTRSPVLTRRTFMESGAAAAFSRHADDISSPLKMRASSVRTAWPSVAASTAILTSVSMTTLSTSSVPDCRSALTLPNFGWSTAKVHGRPLAMNVIEVSVMTAGIMVCSGLGLGSFVEFFVVEVFFLDLHHFRPGEKRQVVAHLRDRLPVLVRVMTRAIEDHLEKRVLDAQFLVSLIDRGDRASFSSGLVDSPMLFVLPIYGDGPVR